MHAYEHMWRRVILYRKIHWTETAAQPREWIPVRKRIWRFACRCFVHFNELNNTHARIDGCIGRLMRSHIRITWTDSFGCFIVCVGEFLVFFSFFFFSLELLYTHEYESRILAYISLGVKKNGWSKHVWCLFI